jgi:AraC-like DNA-binding protein
MHILEIKMPVPSLQAILEENGVNFSLFHRIISQKWRDNSYAILPSIQGILHQLLHCPYQGGLSRLYREAKILELISVYLSEALLQTDVSNTSPTLSSDDMKCVALARAILDHTMTNPPTIRLLSKMVGLNEFKLKKGFKALFEMPVHTYVIQRKLELAKLMLDSSTVSVSEAASRAGYGNASHFAAAFRKQYGINPGAYVKNIKN